MKRIATYFKRTRNEEPSPSPEEARRDHLADLSVRPLLHADGYAQNLYERYGFGDTPTPLELKPLVVEMLGSAATQLTAVELMYGRMIDYDELAERYPRTNMMLLHDMPASQKFDDLLEATFDPDYDRRGDHWC